MTRHWKVGDQIDTIKRLVSKLTYGIKDRDQLSSLCCIYRYIHIFVVIMMFLYGDYCFTKWKFKFWKFLSEIRTKRFSIGQNFCSIDRNGKEIYHGVFAYFDRCSIPVRLIEKSIRSIERNSRLIETCKNEFFAKFSSDYSESLKRFQVLWTVLWNISTLHMCLLMKYNHMSINRSLC